MPKVETDADLLLRARQAVDFYGSVNTAARALGLERTKFWRFIKTGRALPSTRAELHTALATHQSATDVAQITRQAGVLGVDDVRTIRRVFSGVLVLLDSYERTMGEAADSPAMKASATAKRGVGA